MGIKSVLCIFGGRPEELNSLSAAFALGAQHQAHIRFLHISRKPADYFYPVEVAGYAEVVESIEKENTKLLEKAQNSVSAFAEQNRFQNVSAHFVHCRGDVRDIVTREGRLSDLIIISRAISPVDMTYEPSVLAALFETGRPLLLLPAKVDQDHKVWQNKTLALAWDGSREASCAMHHALPVLKRCEKLYILCVTMRHKADDASPFLDLKSYMQLHGVQSVEVIEINAKDHSIADSLLNAAKELKADMLVAGAYGHNRYREMLFGGVTKNVLEKADLPLWLAH